MKKLLYAGIVLVTAVFCMTGCGNAAGNHETAGGAEEITFPIGQAIRSDSFSGTAYLASMIANDDVYHLSVTDEYYANLETEEYQERATTLEKQSFMFPKAEGLLTSDTFSGPAYVSTIIGDNNAAGAPDLHYVVFNTGVISNWHIHEGGQILITTDGIGYHQIEGDSGQKESGVGYVTEGTETDIPVAGKPCRL